MDEEQAKKFIRRQLAIWVGSALTLIGIGNLLAAWHLWDSVMTKTAATVDNQVLIKAQEYANKKLDPVKELVDSARKRIDGFDTNYAKLVEDSGVAKNELTHLLKQLDMLQSKITELNRLPNDAITSLTDAIKELPEEKKNQLLSIGQIYDEIKRIESKISGLERTMAMSCTLREQTKLIVFYVGSLDTAKNQTQERVLKQDVQYVASGSGESKDGPSFVVFEPPTGGRFVSLLEPGQISDPKWPLLVFERNETSVRVRVRGEADAPALIVKMRVLVQGG